jgi:uncharacterized protein YndB with AHSA1/START domain
MPNTIRFHRVLRATPEKVYRAFLDAGALAKWLPPNGPLARVFRDGPSSCRTRGCTGRRRPVASAGFPCPPAAAAAGLVRLAQ